MTTPHSPQTRTPKKKKPASKGAKASPEDGNAKPAQVDGSAELAQGDGSPDAARKPSAKRGKKEEYSAPIPRVRQVFAMMLQNQKDDKRRFPTNADIGKMLQPDDPLGTDAVRAIMDMMRDDLGMPVDYIAARKGHGFTEPVAGFPLDAISEEQAYYLIQCVQSLAPHRGSKMYADIRTAIKRACLGICFALNIDFENIEEALSFHVVGFDAPAPVDPELFKVAMRAILQKQEVTLEHRSVKRRGEVKHKRVEPLHLAMINHALYLWHYDPELEGKKDEDGKAMDPIRKFALTRIGKLEATGRTCQSRAFDVHERVRRGMGAFDEEKLESVELRFSEKIAPLILERRWHPSQTVTMLPDGGLVMGLRVSHSPELEGFVLRWAGGVEVMTPGKLRKRMWELGDALVEAHGQGRADFNPLCVVSKAG